MSLMRVLRNPLLCISVRAVRTHPASPSSHSSGTYATAAVTRKSIDSMMNRFMGIQNWK